MKTYHVGFTKCTASVGQHSVFYSIVLLWLNSVTSLFLSSSFTILHPAIGVLSTLLIAKTDYEILVLYFRSNYPLVYLIYSIVKSQAYLLLWFYVSRFYSIQKESKDLYSSWKNTVNYPKRFFSISLLVFLILAVIRVIIYG